MKALLLSVSFLALIQFAHANENAFASTSSWIDTNNVLISNSQNPDIARKDCETTMRILSIMSNDKIVFQSMCERVTNPRCNYYFCYQLSVKALVITQPMP